MTRIRGIALLLVIMLVTATSASAVYSGVMANAGKADTKTYTAPEESEVFSYAEETENKASTEDAQAVTEESEETVSSEDPETADNTETTENAEEPPEAAETEETAVEEITPVAPIEVTTVTIDQKELLIKTNETGTLKAKALPSNASDTSIIWFSSDSEIAEVSENGEVTGIMEGTAVITAMSAASPWILETCMVTVEKSFLTSILLGRKTVKLSVGSVMPIAVITAPETAYDKTYTWSCDNEEVAEMLPGNMVKALKPGTVTFTATANEYKEDGRPAEAKVLVTVISTADYYCTVGKSITFKASVPTDYPEALIWNVYKLTKNSFIEANGEVDLFTSKLTCRFFGNVVGEYRVEILDPEDENNTQIIHVNVKEPVKRVVAYLEGDEENKKIRRTELTLNQDGTNPKIIQLYAAVEPESATYKDVYWKSSKPDIVSVDENGVVMPLGVGSAVITCVSAADGKKSTFSVTVKYNPKSLTLNKTEPVTLGVGGTVKLKATLDKFKSSSSVVVWESSNPEAVTVKDGKVTAVGVGEATITASSVGGNVSASVEVKAIIAPKRVVAEFSKMKLKVGDKVNAAVRLEPADASETELEYKSRNPAVATVDSYGNITAVGVGTTTVTVTAVNGKKANISVVVK